MTRSSKLQHKNAPGAAGGKCLEEAHQEMDNLIKGNEPPPEEAIENLIKGNEPDQG